MAKIRSSLFDDIRGRLGNTIFQGKKNLLIIRSKEYFRRIGQNPVQIFNRIKYRYAIYHSKKISDESKYLYDLYKEKQYENWFNELVRRVEKTILQSTVISYFFDELQGTTVYNIVYGNFDGQLIGNSWETSNFGVNFDGIDDYIDVPDPNGQLIQPAINQLSVFMWVLTTYSGEFQCLAEHGDESSIGWHFYIDPHNGLYTNLGGEQLSSDPGLIEQNKFYFVGFTWDGATVRIYLNTEEVASASVSSLFNVGTKLLIGRRLEATNPPYYLHGKVLFFSLHNKALTIDEIKNLYNATYKYIPW